MIKRKVRFSYQAQCKLCLRLTDICLGTKELTNWLHNNNWFLEYDFFDFELDQSLHDQLEIDTICFECMCTTDTL